VQLPISSLPRFGSGFIPHEHASFIRDTTVYTEVVCPNFIFYCDIYRLKAESTEQEERFVAKLQHGKKISAATSNQATTEELLEAVFSMRSMTSCSTAVHDRIQWYCVRGGENSGHYNCLKSHEAK
jgi:hypothetical protein